LACARGGTLKTQLIHLSTVDVAIVAVYFVAVLFIGFYVRGSTRTSKEFFMAGREMTAWIAGLSFISANLGSLEMMGWAGSTYQYGILALHAYWIGAIPAMLFLGLVMMPFYYISKTYSVPGYLHLRFGNPARAFSAISFAFMTILMSGINMYSMALVMKVVLGWDLNFSIWLSSLVVAIYVALGGLRSAIFNEILQFFLIWAGALLVPILGMIEVGGWKNLTHQIQTNLGRSDYTHLWSTMGHFKDNPMGVHWTGLVFGWGFVLAFGYWTTDFLVVQRVLAANSLRSARIAPIIGAAFKMLVPLIVILPGLLALALLPFPLLPEGVAVATHGHSYNEVLPLMLVRYCGPGLIGLGVTALIAGFMSGMAGNVSAFSTVWTYDIYGAFLNKKASDRHYVAMGRWCALIGRARLGGHGVPGAALCQHHGLCLAALQLLRGAAFWNCHFGNAVEASYQPGRLLGIARRHTDLHWIVGVGGEKSLSLALCRAFSRCESHVGKFVPRAVGLAYVCWGHGAGKPGHQASAGERT
jgi:SSS family solute:Na+ symporter